MSAVGSLILTLLLWLLWLVLGLLGLVLLVLFLPMDFAGRVDAPPGSPARWSGRLTWGWWLLRLRVQGEGLNAPEVQARVLGFRLRLSEPKARPTKAEDAAKQPKKRKRRRSLDVELLRAYLRETPRFARRLMRAARLRLEGDLRFGFEDPSLTGILLGALHTAQAVPPELTLRPEFLEPTLEGWAKLQGRTYGFEILTAALSFWWHLPYRHRSWRRFKHRTLRFAGR